MTSKEPAITALTESSLTKLVGSVKHADVIFLALRMRSATEMVTVPVSLTCWARSVTSAGRPSTLMGLMVALLATVTDTVYFTLTTSSPQPRTCRVTCIQGSVTVSLVRRSMPVRGVTAVLVKSG